MIYQISRSIKLAKDRHRFAAVESDALNSPAISTGDKASIKLDKIYIFMMFL
jgi:hypothetical protein